MKISCLSFFAFLILSLIACTSNNVDKELLTTLQNEHTLLQQEEAEAQRKAERAKNLLDQLSLQQQQNAATPTDPTTDRLAQTRKKIDIYLEQFNNEVGRMGGLAGEYSKGLIATDSVRTVHQDITQQVARVKDALGQLELYAVKLGAEPEGAMRPDSTTKQ